MFNLKEYPYIIAEIGVNHENSLEKAIMMIHQIAKSGGHAAKFQAYKANKLASKISPAYWDISEEKCDSQYKLFKKYDLFTFKDYKILAKECESVGIDFLCTPFDLELVDELESLMPYIKIASADITNYPLLEKIAMLKKPIILSTGASNISEITYSLNYLKDRGIKDVAILHCVLSYPTSVENAQLNTIKYFRSVFKDALIGYSDHTKPEKMLIPFISYIQGAQIIEKHFTYDKTLPGNDHYHAMDSSDLSQLCKMISTYKLSLGENDKIILDCEKAARREARRGLVASHDLAKGQILQKKDIEIKRPAHGLEPKDIDWVIGRVLKCNIKSDNFIQKEDLV